MGKSHVYIILMGAATWTLIYFLSQSVLEKTKTKMISKLKSSFPRTNEGRIPVTEYSAYSEQISRHDLLKEVCMRLKMNDFLPTDDESFMKMIRYHPLYFSDKFKFIACMIPKVGCTNFKRVMLMEHGLTNVTDPENLPGSVATEAAKQHFRLDVLKNATEIRTRLKNYYKFMMVREPMHRLLSAFRNKFENLSKTSFKIWTKEIIKFSNNEAFERSNDTITFEKFLRYITVDSNKQDNHWKHYYKLCSPCSIEYDFIAKIENVDDDMNYVVNRVGMTNVPYPGGYLEPTDENKVTKYFQKIPANLTRAVYATYKEDFEMFGYTLPDNITIQENIL